MIQPIPLNAKVGMTGVESLLWDPLSGAKKSKMGFSVFSTSVCAQILEKVCATGVCMLYIQPVSLRLPHTHLLYCFYTHAYTHTPTYIQNISTYWALSNILSPQAHVGAVLNGGASLLLVIPATVRVSGS